MGGGKLARIITITGDEAGQRIDNFLLRHLKGVPKTRIYRALRKGEVRVNKGRIKPEYRLAPGDEVRIPPIRVSAPKAPLVPGKRLQSLLNERILVENSRYLVINKPSGLPVHGGSQVSAGLIESLRVIRPDCSFLELVHRLDKETSGCLIIAKKRSLLRELHQLLTLRKVRKQYLALVKGNWKGARFEVEAPLLKNVLSSGERIVCVKEDGKSAKTVFMPLAHFEKASLMSVMPVTGRTHQIRVHAAHVGHPIAGDRKYGDTEFNKLMRTCGLNRLFLHSAGISLQCGDGELIGICALLDEDLRRCLRTLSKGG